MDQRNTLIIAFLLEGLQYCAGATYDIEIPRQLSALKHSCVIIPCSYSYSTPKQSSGSIMGIWFHGINENFKDFIKSRAPKNHVSFTGDLGNGDCSIKIHNVRSENMGSYKFRVEMNHFKYSYKSVVQLNVIDNPPLPILVFPDQTIPEATIVTLKCSTTYTCSSDVANLVWSSNEGQPTVTRIHQDGVWKVESTQVFQVRKNHDGMSFSCHTNYNSGVKSQAITRNLRISYKPKILQNSQCKSVLSAIYCECAAIANPTANITWHSKDVNTTEFSIKSSSDGSKTVSRLEGALMPSGDIWCTASNTEGSMSQNLTIHEAPQIIQESHCKKSWSAIYCECAATASPAANITWHSMDITNITETSGFSINSSSRGSKTVSRLDGAVMPPGGIWCTASNMEGSVTHKLLVHVNWTQPALTGGGILAFLIFCIIGAVFAIKKCRSQKKKPLRQNSYIRTDTKHDDVSTDDGMSRYHTRKDPADGHVAVLYEESETLYMNSEFQNENDKEDYEEVYTAVVKAKEEKDENEEEGIYANC